jgi:hypothetical protein
MVNHMCVTTLFFRTWSSVLILRLVFLVSVCLISPFNTIEHCQGFREKSEKINKIANASTVPSIPKYSLNVCLFDSTQQCSNLLTLLTATVFCFGQFVFKLCLVFCISVSFLLLQTASPWPQKHEPCAAERVRAARRALLLRAVLIPTMLFAYRLLPSFLSYSSICLISPEGSFSLFKAWLSGTGYSLEQRVRLQRYSQWKWFIFGSVSQIVFSGVTVAPYSADL